MAAKRTAAQKAAARKNLEKARKARKSLRAENRSFGLTGRGGLKRSKAERAQGVEEGAISHTYGGGTGKVARAKKDPAKALARHAKKKAAAKSKSKSAKATRAKKAAATRRARRK